ncbi:hypothetical protein F7725_000695 [Dissostichus mawsoni]|uniref:Uncharacterized protein n=1 Tax=Dissostichus mawsoni TaxID=36200 RepID=A0A7J5ZFP4_DISMA|nr:hypothetical protein F7725_000695 [Dissostichus mawsoni]
MVATQNCLTAETMEAFIEPTFLALTIENKSLDHLTMWPIVTGRSIRIKERGSPEHFICVYIQTFLHNIGYLEDYLNLCDVIQSN